MSLIYFNRLHSMNRTDAESEESAKPQAKQCGVKRRPASCVKR